MGRELGQNAARMWCGITNSFNWCPIVTVTGHFVGCESLFLNAGYLSPTHCFLRKLFPGLQNGYGRANLLCHQTVIEVK